MRATRPHLRAVLAHLLAERRDEVGADRALLALHRAGRVPLGEGELGGRLDEVAPGSAAPRERAGEAAERRGHEIEIGLRYRAEEDFVLEVVADRAALADDERDDDR